jgi:hypothetical protein
MKNSILRFISRWKLKFTRFENLPYVVTYNPYVDMSKYVRDKIWSYLPFGVGFSRITVGCTYDGIHIWTNILKFTKGVNFDIRRQTNFHKMPNSKYFVDDYEYDIFHNGKILFKLKPYI